MIDGAHISFKKGTLRALPADPQFAKVVYAHAGLYSLAHTLSGTPVVSFAD